MKKQAQIILSLVGVVATALITQNLFIAKMNEKDRAVASFGERNSQEQIKWEQNLARDLSAQGAQAQLPTQVSWQDVLVYEVLKGQYQVSFKQGTLDKVILQDNQEGVQIDTEKFMKEFAPKIKKFSKFEIKKGEGPQEIIELQDSLGQSAGSFNFIKNDQGRVTEITVQ